MLKKNHCELWVVYGLTVMREGTVRRWCRKFKDEQTNVHDEERSGRPAICSDDDLVQSVDQNICDRRRIIISELLCKFLQISHTVLYEIIRLRLGYHRKFCARWVPKMLTGAHKTHGMVSALTFQSDNTKMAMNFTIIS
jgi:hypothetical protein